MRAWICSLVSCSVSETLIVRSNGSSPLWTRCERLHRGFQGIERPQQLRRNRLRVTSIFLARPISSSRVSSGISAICERYMRIGSLEPAGMPSFEHKRAVAVGTRLFGFA